MPGLQPSLQVYGGQGEGHRAWGERVGHRKDEQIPTQKHVFLELAAVPDRGMQGPGLDSVQGHPVLQHLGRGTDWAQQMTRKHKYLHMCNEHSILLICAQQTAQVYMYGSAFGSLYLHEAGVAILLDHLGFPLGLFGWVWLKVDLDIGVWLLPGLITEAKVLDVVDHHLDNSSVVQTLVAD